MDHHKFVSEICNELSPGENTAYCNHLVWLVVCSLVENMVQNYSAKSVEKMAFSSGCEIRKSPDICRNFRGSRSNGKHRRQGILKLLSFEPWYISSLYQTRILGASGGTNGRTLSLILVIAIIGNPPTHIYPILDFLCVVQTFLQ